MLATPVAATAQLLTRLGDRLGGRRSSWTSASTKRSIVAAAEAAGLGPRYVGAHPLTGSHRSGWGASRASLFDEARVFLCPSARRRRRRCELAESFWRALRAGVEVLAPRARRTDGVAQPSPASGVDGARAHAARGERAALGARAGRTRHDAPGRRRSRPVDGIMSDNAPADPRRRSPRWKSSCACSASGSPRGRTACASASPTGA